VVRRFSDPVEVRSASGPRREPEAFIWRGRLYVVRDVLGHWHERRAWWRDPVTEGPETTEGAAGGADGRGSSTLVAAAREQQVWRVEASPGWSFTPGVYDLARDESPRGEQWSLVRVAD
jgi:hypothetical protein